MKRVSGGKAPSLVEVCPGTIELALTTALVACPDFGQVIASEAQKVAGSPTRRPVRIRSDLDCVWLSGSHHFAPTRFAQEFAGVDDHPAA